MPNNYVLLETIALTQTATSVTFDNLPTSGYTDLKVVMSARLTTAGYDGTPWVVGEIRLNNTAITSGKLLFGTGSAAGSDNNANAAFISDTDATANTFSSMDMYLPNYRSSNNKSVSIDVVTENNGTASLIGLQALLSTVAVPVTSITFLSNLPGLYAVNSTFSLYGIAALGTTPVLAPKATGGNIVANDGTYWYHAFTSSGNFVPQVGLTADVLVVAGGGGGGDSASGGGGAGGYRLETNQALLNATNYACTIGAGGLGASGTAVTGANGSNSVFAGITSTGGGGGGGDALPAGNGGSGGGGAYNPNSGGTAGTASPAGQGNNGGSGNNTASNTGFAGGGGGGAGGAGVNGASGSTGGAGSNSASAWATATNTGVSGFYAGGGGGARGSDLIAASGGAGGGGTGARRSTSNATSGISNTGGGGGGGDTFSGRGPAGNGGSGIVIIRYPIA